MASAGVDGATTFSPGTLQNQFSVACECCADNMCAGPFGPRNTIGMVYCPPDMSRIFAAPFQI